MNNQLFSDYVGITRYAGVPTEQTTGRLHYNENLYGPSPQCMETLNSLTLEDISLYESNEKDELLEALSAETKIPVEPIFKQGFCGKHQIQPQCIYKTWRHYPAARSRLELLHRYRELQISQYRPVQNQGRQYQMLS